MNSERSQIGNRTHNPVANRGATVSHPQVGLKEVEDILRDVDLNGDGLVDFEGKATLVHLLPAPPPSSSSSPPPPPLLLLQQSSYG